ncbi:MAG: transposase [Pirellulales bacterium]
MSSRSYVQGSSSKLRQGRISQDYACYVISKAALHRRKVLASDRCAKIVLDSWRYLREHDRIKLFAFCIMPDHYHLAFCLMPGECVSKLLEDSNKFTARELNKLWGRMGQFWQEGFHDRNCRNDTELHELCLYIEHNPVRAGLVKSADEWPYSSAHLVNRSMLDCEWWP